MAVEHDGKGMEQMVDGAWWEGYEQIEIHVAVEPDEKDILKKIAVLTIHRTSSG